MKNSAFPIMNRLGGIMLPVTPVWATISEQSLKVFVHYGLLWRGKVE